MRRIFIVALGFIAIIISSFTLKVHAGALSLNGSTTVSNFAFFKKEAALAKKIGIDFTVQPTSSGRGLLALHDNETDVAMISSEIAVLVDKLNMLGHELSIDDFVVHKINETKVLFAVNKNNPVSSMSLDHVQGIFTGRISEWSDLGVKGLGSIIVVTEHPTGGVYNTVVHEVLDGEPILKSRITMKNGTQVGLVVSQNSGAIGMVSAATPQNQLENSKILLTPEVHAVQKLYLVTRKKDDRPDVLRFVNAIQSIYAEK